MDICKLPKIFINRHDFLLARKGCSFDGGYIIDPRAVDDTDILISFGVSDNWTFEEDFVKGKNIRLYSFDGSVGLTVYIKNLAKSMLSLFNSPTKSLHWISTIINYSIFFRGKNTHIKKYIGFDYRDDLISFERALEISCYKESKNIFLKIDIEGWEYRMLDSIIAHKNNIKGLVIEFHDVDLHIDKVVDFIQKIGLTLVCTTVNNAAPIAPNGVPLVIECSFTPYPPNINNFDISKLIQPNVPRLPEIKINYV